MPALGSPPAPLPLLSAALLVILGSGCFSSAARSPGADGDLAEDRLAQSCPEELHLVVEVRDRLRIRVTDHSVIAGRVTIGELTGPGSYTFPLRYRQHAIYQAIDLEDGNVVGTSSRHHARATDAAALHRECLRAP